MNRLKLSLALLLFAAPAGLFAATPAAPAPAATPAAAPVVEGPAAQGVAKDAKGGPVGKLLLQQGPEGVWMRYSFTNLTPGWHAMHFHAVGDCSDSAFQKSGGHINLAEGAKKHGLLNPEGPDFGDLPNFFVGTDGTAAGETYTPLVRLSPDSSFPNLLDKDGSALVVHAGPDDHISQPIGGAGARVACAVLQPLSPAAR